MKFLILYFISFFLTSNCIDDSVFEFGNDEGEEVSHIVGSIGPTVDARRTVIPFTLPPCTQMTHVNVVVQNPLWRPAVSVDAVKQQVVILYRYNHNSRSTYEISVKAVTDVNCTATSNGGKHSEEEDDNSDIEYIDDSIVEEDGEEADNASEFRDETKEAYDAYDESTEPNVKRKSEHAGSLTAARLVPSSRALRYGGMPGARAFKPLDDQSINHNF